MLERQYRLDPWLAILAVVLPMLLSLPFVFTAPLTQTHASLVLAAKTLGLLGAPGYPLYLLLTHGLAWLLPVAAWAARLQLIHIIYLGALSGLIYQLGRTLMFPPLVCLITALSMILTPWIWPDVLTPIPLTLHLCFLTLFLIMTFQLVIAPPTRFFRLTLLGWGALAGITGGQEFFLWLWVIPALLLGIMLFPGKKTSRLSALTWPALGLLLGTFAPYAYLPARLFSLHAFHNPDLAPQFSAWRASPTVELFEQWLLFYFREIKFLLPGLSGSVHGAWDFVRSLPFLTLCCWIIGAGIHGFQLLFQPVRPPSLENTGTARLLAGGLPLLVILAATLIFSRQAGVQALTWVLSGTLWGFSGFNYIYEELGYPVSAAAKPRLSSAPTAFGVLVLILVPLLAWVQVYPRLQFISRRAQTPSAPAEKTRAFLNTLPPKAMLVFSSHADSHLAAYLQEVKKIRPDVQRLAWSESWPNTPYTGRTVLEPLGATPESRLRRRLNFADYWNQLLLTELLAGRTVYLITPAFPNEPLYVEFLQRFELSPDRGLEKQLSPDEAQTLWVFDVHPQRPKIESVSAGAGKALGMFDRYLRLQRADTITCIPLKTRDSWLSFRLTWDILPACKPHPYYLEFRALPLGSRDGVFTLGQRHWIQTAEPPAAMSPCFSETYQFFLPDTMSPGRYRLYVALWDAAAKEWIPASKSQDASGYGVLVGEFPLAREFP
jgi:hypothetical protein